jgi:hypothetical protein
VDYHESWHLNPPSFLIDFIRNQKARYLNQINSSQNATLWYLNLSTFILFKEENKVSASPKNGLEQTAPYSSPVRDGIEIFLGREGDLVSENLYAVDIF